MINEELFEGPVGDYCIARNTIKCLFLLFCMSVTIYYGEEQLYSNQQVAINMSLLTKMTHYCDPNYCICKINIKLSINIHHFKCWQLFLKL